MGNYGRQHITFASAPGRLWYSVGAFVMMGVHWFYGTVATLLATLERAAARPRLVLGGRVEGIHGNPRRPGGGGGLGIGSARSSRRRSSRSTSGRWSWPSSRIRHGLRRVLSRLAKHRGISHSLPTCGVWGLATYLYYPSNYHGLRVLMAAAVMVGFFSHLLLDEICSVDLKGARVNKAFGTAIKLWAPSPWSTLAMYGLLSYLAWLTIQRWPTDPDQASTSRPLEHARSRAYAKRGRPAKIRAAARP